MKVVDLFNSIFLWLIFFFPPEKKNRGRIRITDNYIHILVHMYGVYMYIMRKLIFFIPIFYLCQLNTFELLLEILILLVLKYKEILSMSFHVWFSMKNFKQLSKLISLCNICNCLLLTFIYSHLLCTFMEITCFISPKTCFL